MAAVRPAKPELLIVAAFSRHDAAIAWARQRLIAQYGDMALESEPYEFAQTDYYAGEMGAGLRKHLLAFATLVAADSLPAVKRYTNRLETELAESGQYPERRPLNLDPGLLNQGKFMLATTKDQAHRIYLGEGVFAEVTLRFQDGQFEPWPWTYADYRLPKVREFLGRAREYYKQLLARQPHA